MPPKGVKSPKRKRQYEHIKRSLQERGSRRAEQIAARTVNKQRRKAGQTKAQRAQRSSRSSSTRRKSAARRRSR